MYFRNAALLVFVLAAVACSHNGSFSGPDLALSDVTIQQLSVGYFHNCVVTSAGNFCWGSNLDNELGDGSGFSQGTPVEMTVVPDTSYLAAGDFNTCAIVGGGVQCWGANTAATLGASAVPSDLTSQCTPAQNCYSATPVTVEAIGGGGALTGVTAVHSGVTHSCAITTGGGLACWGENFEGQLGTGNTNFFLAPAQVSGLTSGVTQVHTGAYNDTCAIVSGGVQCWGANTWGEVGVGTTTVTTSPVAVPGLTSGVTAIAVGNGHACAIQAGAVFCWGFNPYGQVGDGTTIFRTTPVPVPSITSGATAIALGDYFSCALVNGGVQCWGLNTSGQLGNGSSSTTSDNPVPVTGLTSGVTTLGAGEGHACAVQGGQIFCWGNNQVGEDGNGSDLTPAIPVLVVNPKIPQPAPAP